MLKHSKYGKKYLKLKLVLIICIVLCVAVMIDKAIRPLIITHCSAEAKYILDNTINLCVYDYLDECGYSYHDLSHLTRGDDNSVNSIEIDSIKVNLIAAKILTKVNSEIDKIPYITVKIPLGTLSNIDFLNGRGPRISIKMNMTSNISADFSTTFFDAGINQTLHNINVVISAEIYLMNMFYHSSFGVTNTYIIAQTIIVGDIPSVVLDNNGQKIPTQYDNING